MAVSAPLQLAEEMKTVSKAMCFDFVRFRAALKQHRSKCDDNIRQRLSSIQSPHDQCLVFTKNLKNAQASRRANLESCLIALKEEEETFKDSVNCESLAVIRKEKSLLEAELIVEDIVCAQSRVLLDNKLMKALSTFTVVYCPVESCLLECPFSSAQVLMEHLKTDHRISIFEPEAVAPFLDQYLEKCALSFKTDFQGELGDDDEDQSLRQQLHISMLQNLLDSQQIERNTVYKRPRMCLFCLHKADSLPNLFTHMFQEHRFNIGLLENLVFIDAYLNDLEAMLSLQKQCIYCKEIFRNRTCLRKHLKSKNHYKIDSKECRWDKYYLVNYMNLTKAQQAVDRNEPNVDEDDNWDDLVDEIDSQTQCLFCELISMNPEECFDHMGSVHFFIIQEIQKNNNLNFYSTMKLVNYLRHCQRYNLNLFSEKKEEEQEMDWTVIQNRFRAKEIPDGKLWDRPEFYFPVYDEDPLLMAIDDLEIN